MNESTEEPNQSLLPADMSIQRGITRESPLHIDLMLARKGMQDYQQMLARLPAKLRAKVDEVTNSHLTMVYTGIAPERMWGDLSEQQKKFTTRDYKIIKAAVEADPNYAAIHLNETQISFINLEAAGRVMDLYPNYFDKVKTDKRQWLTTLAFRRDGAQLGLLSGFPKEAVNAFMVYALVRDKPNDTLTPHERQIKDAAFGVHGVLGGFFGFSPADQAWTDRLTALYTQVRHTK